nr:LysM peptidoglycan-binding domain-containing protein [Saprospiraceae bacterium]
MTKLKLIFCFWITFGPLTLTGQTEWVVFINSDQTIITTHTIQSGETLYSISRNYNLSVEELSEANSSIDFSALRVGSQLNIPLSDQKISPTKPSGDYAGLNLEIIPGQTLFAISQASGLSIDEIQNLNDLEGTELSLGRAIQLGYYSFAAQNTRSGIETEVALEKKPSNQIEEKHREILPLDNKEDKKEVELTFHHDRGVAVWNEEWKSTSGFYVLHRSAPINSIIEIENPMFNRRAFGKVSGRIPASLYSSDVILIVSDGLARHLGVIDPRFFVKVRYLQPN